MDSTMMLVYEIGIIVGLVGFIAGVFFVAAGPFLYDTFRK